jgi:hypothetical protein
MQGSLGEKIGEGVFALTVFSVGPESDVASH